MAKKEKALTESQFQNGHTIKYIDDADSVANRDSLLEAGGVAGGNLGSSAVASGGGDKKAKKYRPREQWRSKTEFVLSCIAFAVGLGNVWRFPYLCYKNGGGAFMVPYIICVATAGIPILILEAGIGQYWQTGGLTVWNNLCPISKGVGYGSVVALFLLNIYYIIILAWALLYLVFSFNSTLPWSTCGNFWNSAQCATISRTNDTARQLAQSFSVSQAFNASLSSRRSDSTVEFWEHRILQMTDGIENVGGIQWELAACLAVVWVICFFCIWKGIKSTGRSAYIIALLPYISLTILLIRGITLPGYMKGLEFYLRPNFSKITDFNVWADAGTQIFFSYALALGCLTALGSYNPFKNDFYKQLVFVATLDSSTSVFAGFAIFSVLGFMADQKGVEVSQVAEKGPGLAFIVYPQAVAQMPWAPFWSVQFFLMILLLGVGSQFVSVEGFITAVVDLFPGYLRVGKRREWFIGATCFISFLLGLTMVTRNGIYVFQLFDYYAASGMCLLFLCFCECAVVSWIYGVDKFVDNCKEMIGYRPAYWFKLCWKYLSPLLTGSILLMLLFDFKPLRYNDYYEYPAWATAIGWIMAMSSIIQVPGYAIYAYLTTPGSPSERWRILTAPTGSPANAATSLPLTG